MLWEAAMHMIQGMNLKLFPEGIEDEMQYNKNVRAWY